MYVHMLVHVCMCACTLCVCRGGAPACRCLPACHILPTCVLLPLPDRYCPPATACYCRGLQAIARVYRMGQQQPTFIYRLLYAGTMEERNYKTNLVKEELFQRVGRRVGGGWGGGEGRPGGIRKSCFTMGVVEMEVIAPSPSASPPPLPSADAAPG